MYNFSIQFNCSPWLLLLFIPALALALIPYFRLSKRYRKTRNRISSLVLFLTVAALAISVLSGMTFHYDVPNTKNEIILLVDVSDTEEDVTVARDAFVENVLLEASYDSFNVGIVTFGFDQEYVFPLSGDLDTAYDSYMLAENKPDTSATNIAAALSYAKDLFHYPETGKIVLITDGKETDEEAEKVIRSVAAQGIRVDIAYFSEDYKDADIQIVGIEQPDYHMLLNENFSLGVTLKSSTVTDVAIEMYDNGVKSAITPVITSELIEGKNTIYFDHMFDKDGLHELTFKIILGEDTNEKNNEYHTYLFMDLFNDLLILDGVKGQSALLVADLLNGEDENAFNTDVRYIHEDELPQTIDELRAYDQIILNNIANDDLIRFNGKRGNRNENLPENFDLMLEQYVQVYGGGLFTVGGSDAQDSELAHAYNREDMYGTRYQKMLPVEAVNYTPPVAVMVIIDRSLSMETTNSSGEMLLTWARAGASVCYTALTERDYLGVMTLDDYKETILPLTLCTTANAGIILGAIDSIASSEGSTVFPGAIEAAGQELIAIKNVDRRHIIVITDGMVPEGQAPAYLEMVEKYNKYDGITVSVVGVNVQPGSNADRQMQAVAELGQGRVYTVEASGLVDSMREDLNAPAIKAVEQKEFNPTVLGDSPITQNLERCEDEASKNKLKVTLDGFYGVKKRPESEVILTGEYGVPIYAQWRYGKGMVGSFMCDLNGQFSSNFVSSEDGAQLIKNIVNNLMPMENIEPRDITLELTEDNYTNHLSVTTTLEKGQSIRAKLVDESTGETFELSLNDLTVGDALLLRTSPYYVTSPLLRSTNYEDKIYREKCTFVVKKSGVYKIVVEKLDENGEVISSSTAETYKALAYSEEYDTFIDAKELEIENKLANLAERGKGVVIEDVDEPYEVFEGFITSLHKVFDPRFLFMILSIVLFLTDVAVRKFKFKWPHEIIRDYKNKKNSK